LQSPRVSKAATSQRTTLDLSLPGVSRRHTPQPPPNSPTHLKPLPERKIKTPYKNKTKQNRKTDTNKYDERPSNAANPDTQEEQTPTSNNSRSERWLQQRIMQLPPTHDSHLSLLSQNKTVCTSVSVCLSVCLSTATTTVHSKYLPQNKKLCTHLWKALGVEQMDRLMNTARDREREKEREIERQIGSPLLP
jgi:hypothetical protein